MYHTPAVGYRRSPSDCEALMARGSPTSAWTSD